MQTEWLNSNINSNTSEINYLSKLNDFLITNTDKIEALSSPEGGEASSSSSSNSNSPASSNDLLSTKNILIHSTTTSSSSSTISPSQIQMLNKRQPSSNDILTSGSIKDSRKSTSSSSHKHNKHQEERRTSSNGSISGEGETSGIHSHPEFEQQHEDHQSGSIHEDEDDKEGIKGLKTSDKRRAQNRAAQRAFRERKEHHLKELEDRVFSLEKASNDKEGENEALKAMLDKLKSENERLKVFESAFSFSYTKDVSNSTSMSLSPQFGENPFNPNRSTSTNMDTNMNLSMNTNTMNGGGFPSSIGNEFNNTTFDLSAASFGLSPSATYPTFTQASPSSNLTTSSSSIPTTTSTIRSSITSNSNMNEFFYNPLTSLPSPTNSSTSTNNTTANSSGNPLTPPDSNSTHSPNIHSTSFSSGNSNDLFLNYRDLGLNPFDLDGSSNTILGDGEGMQEKPLAPIDEFEALFGNLSGSILDTTALPLDLLGTNVFNSETPLSNLTTTTTTKTAISSGEDKPTPVLDLSAYLTSPSPSSSSSTSFSPSTTTTTSTSTFTSNNSQGEGIKIPMIDHSSAVARNLLLHGNSNCPIVQAARAVAGWSSTGGAGAPTGAGGVREGGEVDMDGLCSDMKAKATCQEAARVALQEAMQEDANTSMRLFPSL